MTLTTTRTATPPEGRRPPTEDSGGCSDCSSGCEAAHPATDPSQVSALDLLYGALIETEKQEETHLLGSVDSKFEATADHVKAEANEPVEHAFKERETAINGLNDFLYAVTDCGC